jgi:hypothetical protein
MKKIYLLALFIPIFSQAQTITQSDLPFAGLAFTTANDSNYVASIPAGGTSQTWNYAGLLNLVIDTSGFQNASGTPYVGTFSSSNLAAYDWQSGGYSYFSTNSSGFYTNGTGTPGGNTVISPPLLFAPVPFSFGDSRVNNSRIVVDTVVTDTTGTSYNIHAVIHFTQNFLADGTGTLILPNATFSNTLRIKITETVYDSLFINLGGGIYIPLSNGASQTTTYRWFKPGNVNGATYILGIDADSLGTTSVSSAYLLNSIVLSVPQTQVAATLGSYPLPASSSIRLELPVLNEIATVIITNSIGQVTDTRIVQGTNELQLEVSSYPNGIYYFTVFGSAQRKSGKFIIQH